MNPTQELSLLREALAHISRLCESARVHTKRLAVIHERCEVALEGKPWDRSTDLRSIDVKNVIAEIVSEMVYLERELCKTEDLDYKDDLVEKLQLLNVRLRTLGVNLEQ